MRNLKAAPSGNGSAPRPVKKDAKDKEGKEGREKEHHGVPAEVQVPYAWGGTMNCVLST
jgi:hypothetical protein